MLNLSSNTVVVNDDCVDFDTVYLPIICKVALCYITLVLNSICAKFTAL